jgi:hypothetical protein
LLLSQLMTWFHRQPTPTPVPLTTSNHIWTALRYREHYTLTPQDWSSHGPIAGAKNIHQIFSFPVFIIDLILIF